MDKLKNYILANFKFVLTIVIVIGIQTVLNFIPPSLIRNITSSIERNKTVFSIKTQFIIIILVVLSVYLLKLLLNYLNLRFSLYFKTNNSKNLYNSLFKMDFGSIQKLEPSYFVSRIKGTVDNIFKLIGSNISKVIISSLTLIISILLIIKINTLIAFLFLLLLFVHYFSYKKLNKKLERESITLQKKYSNVPWHVMVSMRNRLIHGYFDIDLDIVWKTTQNDIPKLTKTLKKIIREEE